LGKSEGTKLEHNFLGKIEKLGDCVPFKFGAGGNNRNGKAKLFNRVDLCAEEKAN
jgi:hypothetical protein